MFIKVNGDLIVRPSKPLTMKARVASLVIKLLQTQLLKVERDMATDRDSLSELMSDRLFDPDNPAENGLTRCLQYLTNQGKLEEVLQQLQTSEEKIKLYASEVPLDEEENVEKKRIITKFITFFENGESLTGDSEKRTFEKLAEKRQKLYEQ
jgi:hypothetical protein